MKRLAMFGAAARARHREKEKGRVAPAPLSSRAKERLAGKKILNEWEVYQVASAYGLPIVKTIFAISLHAAVQAAAEVGYPVVVKLMASGVTHKSELGGVKLNLSKPQEVERACREIETAFKARNPEASIEGFLVQEIVRAGVETIIGAENDPQFGPVVMFGLGGTAVEIYRDVTLRLAPVSLTEAAQMIRGIKGYSLLAGFRGTPPVDQEALSRVIVLISELVAAGRDLIQSIDINPFICLPEGSKAADAVIVTRAMQ